MTAPFYNAIKGTTSGTPGTGAFTPNAASSGFRAWSTVPAGWIGLVRYEDGSSWELTYSYWNGTTLSRASTQLYDSSSGSAISLTSAATAAMVVDASEVTSHLGTTPWTWSIPQTGTANTSTLGLGVPVFTGTSAGVSLATTNYLTEQRRIQITSLTTANAQSGWSWTTPALVYSTAAGRGGGEFVTRFGASTIPSGPRLFIGMTGTTFIANTGEPSALTANVAVFGLDSTDTNIQLLVNSNAGSGTKTDTGIPLVANGWYEAAIWWEPGGGKIYGLLIRIDTGAIWLGSTATDIPANGAILMPQVIAGLSSTTGTAMVLHVAHVTLRAGT